MKLLFVTSLKEYQKTVADILNKAEIPVFSVTETIGFKDHHKTNCKLPRKLGQSKVFFSVYKQK
jgi:hypothetical protein